MKKNKLGNVVFIILICLSVWLIGKEVLAATNGNAMDLTNTITSGNTTKNNTTGNTSTNNTSSGNNSVGNTSTKNTSSTANNSVMRTNNTSNYNNSSLPKTGIEDTFPSLILIVVFGISAVYAYKKIKHYRNI